MTVCQEAWPQQGVLTWHAALYVEVGEVFLHGARHMHPLRRPGALGHPCGCGWSECLIESPVVIAGGGAVWASLTVPARFQKRDERAWCS